MKKTAFILVLLMVLAMALAALDFKAVDDLYDQGSDNRMVYDSLQSMLKNAGSDTEKAEVLWRLSRVCVDLGDAMNEKDKTSRFAIYTEGENYAIQSIEAHPNYLAYLWKCANIGRYGQTKGVMDLTCETYPQIKPFLPEKIHFIHADELLKMYPDKTPKEREDAICEAYGAVFVIGIGGALSNGEKHDGRAPDYDDWSTIAEDGRQGLNGDILIWYPVLGRSFELSSMGIRVNKESLLRQLKIEHQEEREQLYFHQQLLQDKLPLSIGGGIGQSRLCMVLLHKAHIGEIQASIWPDDMRSECKAMGMPLI